MRHFQCQAVVAAGLCVAGAVSAAPIRLTEVNGDGCVPSYVYNAPLSADQIRSKRYPAHAIAVIHDNCSDGDELVVGLDDGLHHLRRSVKAGTPLYQGPAFAGDGIAVKIRGGTLVLKLDETPDICGSEWRQLQVVVTRGRDSLTFRGTLGIGC